MDESAANAIDILTDIAPRDDERARVDAPPLAHEAEVPAADEMAEEEALPSRTKGSVLDVVATIPDPDADFYLAWNEDKISAIHPDDNGVYRFFAGRMN